MESMQALPEHSAFCFEVLIATLSKLPIPSFPKHLLDFEAPLFVTWKKKNDDLRGCIGTFQPGQISSSLPEFALTSALQDTRFTPIQLKELSNLKCGVSFLVNFENGKDAYDWDVGKHGIIIEFRGSHHERKYNGTFLPEVAAEQEWTKDETLQHLIRKAGYTKDWKKVINIIKLQRYQSSKYTLSFDEYERLKAKN